MSKTFRLILLLMLVAAAACGPRGAPSNAAANNGARTPPQIVVGFATPVSASTPTATFTPMPTPTPVVRTSIFTQTVVVTQVVMQPIQPPVIVTAPLPVPTSPPTSTPPPAAGTHCDNPLATITSPAMNAVLRGSTIITGTANTPDMAFYKIQFSSDQGHYADVWGELYQSKEHVQEGKLMEWQTKTVETGVYWLRLLVHRPDGNYGQPCTLRIVVAR